MESLRRAIAQIAKQLDVLTRSQKIAIVLCAALVAGSLFWLVQYSAAPEMAPVLAQDLTLEQVDTALDTLRGDGIPAEQRGNRVYVRPRDRDRALLSLNRAKALPQDTSVGFAELMADSDPFRPSDENKWRRQVALGNELARILARGDNVHSARVITQDKSKRRVGALSDIKPSASVFVKPTAGKAMTRDMVDGICRFVSGAVPGLAPHDVTVVDATTMRSHSTVDPDEGFGVGVLEERKKNEKHLTGKIMAALQSIPGVLVSVSVELDSRRTQTQTQDWATPEVKSDESSSTVTSSAQSPGETGVNSNVGVALTGSAAGTRSETEEGKTDFYESKPVKVENTERAPFTVTRATASVGIPRSYLVGVHQARFGTETDPAKLDEDPEFVRIRDAEIGRVRSKVTNILMARSEDDVDVAIFYDLSPDGPELNTFPSTGSPMMASADHGVTDYARRYGVQGVLMGLALLSFFMMTRMVRRSSDVVKAVLPPERMVSEEDQAEEMLHIAGGGPVGMAAATEGLLVGQEVDEETLRYSQLGEQVSKMVETDPESAAELLRRWASSAD